MTEIVLEFLQVLGLSMFKFFFGPLWGAKLGLHFALTFVAAVGGMTLSVLIFSFFGIKIKAYIVKTFYKKQRRIFTPKNRRIVTVWLKYGLMGIAFLTPPLLTPPIGTLIAGGFGEPRGRIVLYMLVSSLFWGLLVCYAAYELRHIPFLKFLFEN